MLLPLTDASILLMLDVYNCPDGAYCKIGFSDIDTTAWYTLSVQKIRHHENQFINLVLKLPVIIGT